MSTRSDLAGAPADVVIGGVTYLMSPLRDLDLGELDRWVQRKILDVVELSTDDKVRRLGIEMAAVATWAGKYGYALAQTNDGLARYMWVGIRRNHPTLELSKVLTWVMSEDNRIELYRAFNTANGIEEDAEQADPTLKNP